MTQGLEELVYVIPSMLSVLHVVFLISEWMFSVSSRALLLCVGECDAEWRDSIEGEYLC